MKTDEIKSLRSKIDALDADIMQAIVDRQLLSQQVQSLKRSEGQSAYSPKREDEIILSLQTKFPQLPAKMIENLYRELFNWMRPKD